MKKDIRTRDLNLLEELDALPDDCHSLNPYTTEADHGQFSVSHWLCLESLQLQRLQLLLQCYCQ